MADIEKVAVIMGSDSDFPVVQGDKNSQGVWRTV